MILAGRFRDIPPEEPPRSVASPAEPLGAKHPPFEQLSLASVAAIVLALILLLPAWNWVAGAFAPSAHISVRSHGCYTGVYGPLVHDASLERTVGRTCGDHTFDWPFKLSTGVEATFTQADAAKLTVAVNCRPLAVLDGSHQDSRSSLQQTPASPATAAVLCTR